MSAEALHAALERAQGFRALARAFEPPLDPPRLAADLLSLRERARGPLATSLALACDALAAGGAELVEVHERIFGSHGGVPTRESAYADHRSVAPAELADLRGFLCAFGLEERGELADHVASECELASLLALKQAWALAEGETERAEIAGGAYQALVADHLARFVPRFAARVRAAGVPAFYAAAADALESFVGSEAERLGAPLPASPCDLDTRTCEDAEGSGFTCGGCPR